MTTHSILERIARALEGQAAPLLDAEEASSYLRVSRSTVEKFKGLGRIPCVFIGSRTLYRRKDLDQFIESNLNGGGRP